MIHLLFALPVTPSVSPPMSSDSPFRLAASAFVEGEIQEACDDACSICLEAFCECDPSTLTTCKHEFHLQCVLE